MNVHVYTEPGMASVNSYVLEGLNEVIVIDAQRSLSSATKFLEFIKEIGKPIAAIFLTHPHPDHFGGLPILKKAFPEAAIYALAQTRDSMANGANGYIQQSKQALGDDFDEALPLPTAIVQNGEEFTLAEIHLRVEDAGRGEADCMMLLSLPEEDTLFCADVVQHAMTAFLLEGHLEAWLTQISAVQARYGTMQKVYPGHGASGTAADLFSYQRSYLQTFQKLISEQKDMDSKVSPDGKRQIIDAMNRAYPDFLPVAMIPNLLEMDVDVLVGGDSAAA